MAATDPEDVPDVIPLLWELTHAMQAMSRHMERNIGISGPQRLVMRATQALAEPTPGDLAARLGVHPSTITGHLDRLVDRGLLERERRTDDRRSSRLRLTSAGQRLLSARAVTIESVVAAALAEIPADKRADADVVLRRLATALRSAAGESADG
jgi:DNA-binding MarR family transcriptional regulator